MSLRHVSLALLAVCLAASAAAQPALTLEPTTFEARDGRTVEAELGRFRVPENRQRPDSRTIELSFVRFPSTSPTPEAPIVYLGGGPGVSGIGTARGSRFDLFQELRSVADVIAFDQRGTGLSNDLPECPHEIALPLAEVSTRASVAAAAAEVTRACSRFWRQRGVDLQAYTTQESADDLEALRQAIGADQISLWAISYGTHLSLATIRRHPESIARAVLAGVEGPDHTLKLPSDQQALLVELDRLHRAEAPEAGSLLEDMGAVLTQLRAEPVRTEAEVQGETVPLAISAFDVQWLAANMLGEPRLSMQLPGLFASMRAGDFDAVAGWIVYLKTPSGIRPMSTAMDAASGASVMRRARIAAEAERTLLGDAINMPGPVQYAAIGVRDLGPSFRAPVVSDVPTLFISGTLDGRTPPSNADEVREGFSRHAHLVIEGAGHSDPLFLSTPAILDRMRTFFGGEMVAHETLQMAD